MQWWQQIRMPKTKLMREGALCMNYNHKKLCILGMGSSTFKSLSNDSCALYNTLIQFKHNFKLHSTIAFPWCHWRNNIDAIITFHSCYELKCYPILKYSMQKKYPYTWKRGDNFRMWSLQGNCLISMEAPGNPAQFVTS